jgi:hypothetical protein
MYVIPSLFNRRTIVSLAVLLLIMAVAYGFAASNVVADSSAGDGIGNISGYKISGVTYTLATADPRNLSSVSFTIADDGVTTNGVATVPTTLKIGFPASASAAPATWFNCTPPSTYPGTATCSVTGTVKVYDINFLEVVAAN